LKILENNFVHLRGRGPRRARRCPPKNKIKRKWKKLLTRKLVYANILVSAKADPTEQAKGCLKHRIVLDAVRLVAWQRFLLNLITFSILHSTLAQPDLLRQF
jgi:hypothetical protein